MPEDEDFERTNDTVKQETEDKLRQRPLCPGKGGPGPQ